jgi:hemolysin activation/secretion protein
MIRVFSTVFLSLLLAFASVSAAEERPAETAPASPPARRPLRQILITGEGLEAAQALVPRPGAGFVVLAPSIKSAHLAPLTTRLSPGEGQPIDEPLLAAIAQVIENYFKQNDFPVATAIVPPQSIADGTVRVALLPGKIRSIKFEGNRWFSERLLRDKLRIEEGSVLQLSLIDQSLTWTNANAFRHVRVHLTPIAGSGEVDLLVGVREVAPWRVFTTFDNSGNEVLGVNRLTAGFTLANLWGKDHQLTVQHLTSDFSEVFRAETFDYRIPLPWRHWINFSGSILIANPSIFDGFFLQKGRSTNADIRYSMNFRQRNWRYEASFGLSGKQSNNNLEYGGQAVFGTVIDSYQALVSLAAVREDRNRRGRWTFAGTLNYSPGGVNSRNTDEVYSGSRTGANSRFLTLQANVERITRLTDSTSSSLRLTGQTASTNLLPIDQYSLGGSSTIRGYKERILSGDLGYSITHELHQRVLAKPVHPRLPPLDGTAVFFWDHGRTFLHRPERGQNKHDYLASAGVGFRLTMNQVFSASFDHAWQLEKVELPNERHRRTHFRLSLSF